MNYFFKLIITLFIVASITSCSQVNTQIFKGSWIGVAETKPFPELLFMHLDSGLVAKLYYRGIELQPAKNVELSNTQLSFSITQDDYEGRFEGLLIKDTIKGKWKEGDNEYPCHFIRVIPESPELVSEFAGFYQLDVEHIVRCEPFPLDYNLTPMLLTDFKTGKKRVAFPTGNQSYVSGDRQLAPYPTDLLVNFLKDKEDLPILKLYDDGKSLEGKRLSDLVGQIDISANNKEVEISASLYLPDTEAPHPLVVIVHGAGNQTRQDFTLSDFAALLPYYGMATLVYDKRGFGESGGNFQLANFADLAEDVSLLIKKAEELDEIDEQKIGLLGVDQAGLLMPLVSQRNKNIKFIAGISTPIASMQEQELQACENRMQADGFTNIEIQQALQYQNDMFDYLAGKLDSLSFQEQSNKLKDESWKDYVTSFEKKEWIAWWRKNYMFEVESPLKTLSMPMYFIYGGRDPLLNATENIDLLEKNLPPHQLTNKFYPEANHFMYEAGNRGDFQLTEIRGYPKGIFNDLNKWMAIQFDLLK